MDKTTILAQRDTMNLVQDVQTAYKIKTKLKKLLQQLDQCKSDPVTTHFGLV